MIQKGFIGNYLLIGLVALVLIGGVFYLGRISNQNQAQTPPLTQANPTSTPPSVGSSPLDETASWKTYTNTKYRYSIKYPQNRFTSCGNVYEDTGLRLWEVPFDCPTVHDAFYKIGVIRYKSGEYKEYKTPAVTEEITVNGVKATKKTYQYTESDGPLFSSQGSTEIVIIQGNNTYAIQFLGVDGENLKIFDQILSTFKFL